MRRQVLFVGLICVAFLVNAQEEKTIDLDEVTIQASSSMGRSEYEKYLYGEWKRSVAYKWRVGFFLGSRSPLAGGYQTGGISR